jgi:hypothetical protein
MKFPIDRRRLLTLGAATLAGFSPRLALAENPSMNRVTAYAFTF